MKTRTIALSLFTATAVGVAMFPAARGVVSNVALSPPKVWQPPAQDPARLAAVTQSKKIDVVFVLDTTGSMGGLLQSAKEKIWSIASTMASADQAPEIRMGLVAYRDRGDDYVTRITDLSPDLDSMYATLMDFRAAGGGDEAESVNQALDDAVNRISWGQDPNTYKVVFLVGDAPPHMDYQDDVKYTRTLAVARERGIVVNAIRCGVNARTLGPWQQIAQLGAGRFFNVDQTGSAVAIATPFDEQLAKLSRELDATRLFYGSAEEKARYRKKVEATAKVHARSSAAAQARRATFNASLAGEGNLLGDKELVDDVASGRVELEALPEATLPAPMQAMAPAERAEVIKRKAERRNELREAISTLSGQRADYLEKQVDALGGAKDSLDQQLFDAVKAQAGKAGLSYGSDAPAY